MSDETDGDATGRSGAGGSDGAEEPPVTGSTDDLPAGDRGVIGAGSTDDPAAIADAIAAAVERVVVGNRPAVEDLTVALLTRGHVLLEGVPGVAKTTLANAFARAGALEYRRVQMTPDVLPADITGTHVYREQTGAFELQRGPVFANVVVADEINRATPKTQSALLETMQERQVTIEGETIPLPSPFILVATQNPIEMEGVYRLPEAQRDRFQQKVTMPLPDRETEHAVLDRFDDEPALTPAVIEPVVSRADVLAAREHVGTVHVARPVKEYALDLVAATREHPDVVHGASPRASLSFLSVAKGRAAIDGRGYAIPDDVKGSAVAVLAHRLVLGPDAELGDVSPETVVEDVIATVEPPGADEATLAPDEPTPGAAED